jgi:hypothetical protein
MAPLAIEQFGPITVRPNSCAPASMITSSPSAAGWMIATASWLTRSPSHR